MSMLIYRIEVEEDQQVTGELSSPTVPLSTTPEAADPESTAATPKYRIRLIASILYHIFEIEEDGMSATCRLPYFSGATIQHRNEARIKMFNGQTSNLWTHLERWHPNAYKELQPDIIGHKNLERATAEVLAAAHERAQMHIKNSIMDAWILSGSRSREKNNIDALLLLFLVRCRVQKYMYVQVTLQP